ncbi:hypothetical protein [Catellatospora bangladeshensis]|uniref:Uncharacterized protein n=1 Tax=Catellatospora bangladeshensis TaxID=310355 RepID=A0A8J3JKT0_9ACTN|nr:hypothetical protein [Catellatospora bangladeshensis]GIF80730.1 hypothetical protein Cba03nite_20790 [Catellatospora bangladeshensis]
MTTVRDILFGELLPGEAGAAAREVERAAERLAEAGVVGEGPQTPAPALARAVLAKVTELLDIEVSDLLVGAWRTRSALLAAARETYAQPGLRREVGIRSFTMPWEYEADVDVVVDGRTVSTLTAAVTVQLTVTALAAVVEAGRLTALTAGDAVAHGELRFRCSAPEGEHTVVERERPVDLHRELRLGGGGVALIDEARAAEEAPEAARPQ